MGGVPHPKAGQGGDGHECDGHERGRVGEEENKHSTPTTTIFFFFSLQNIKCSLPGASFNTHSHIFEHTQKQLHSL